MESLCFWHVIQLWKVVLSGDEHKNWPLAYKTINLLYPFCFNWNIHLTVLQYIWSRRGYEFMIRTQCRNLCIFGNQGFWTHHPQIGTNTNLHLDMKKDTPTLAGKLVLIPTCILIWKKTHPPRGGSTIYLVYAFLFEDFNFYLLFFCCWTNYTLNIWKIHSVTSE